MGTVVVAAAAVVVVVVVVGRGDVFVVGDATGADEGAGYASDIR